jgi:hypothetical protein
MPRQVYTAVVERNVTWQGAFATEPYEAGWAGEAIVFIRVLKGEVAGNSAAVQISPDGIHWLDEGTYIDIPDRPEGLSSARVSHFGNWLRLAGELPPGQECTVLVYFVLKE